MPRPASPKPRRSLARGIRTVVPATATIAVLALAFFSLPSILALDIRAQNAAPAKPSFPVSVDPRTKTITESPAVEAYLTQNESTLPAAVADAGTVFTWLASAIASLPWYQQLAGADTVFVTIYPGYRKEEVAAAFGSKLDWNSKERQQFLKDVAMPPVVDEGQFAPGTYAVSALATPEDVHLMVYDQFNKDIGERYSTTTAQVVPVSEALTIASLLEREASGPSDMRIISGIIWNRLFVGMNLQIDATLQYAKGTTSKTDWWPQVLPKDKYIKSAYNTYAHPGLPPGPISSPSVAAVLAALNPKKTDCLFYFHDSHGNFHCSATYAQHVALLKKYYGQGK